MPWKVFKDDDKYCVHKIDADDNPVGGSLGCHDSSDEAMAQMEALYANEEKETAVDSFVTRIVHGVGNYVKSLLKADNNESDLMIFKESGGGWQIVTRYSNKFRDDDNPSEIIASESHQKFAKMVEAGLVDPPELWLWHVPDWKIGTGLWATYDDSGFALSGHYIPPENAEIVEVLKSLKDVRVSHGMPKWSVRRSSDDPSVIVEHITTEVSLLPGWAAANKRTGIPVILGKESKEMALSQEQKRELTEKWGIPMDTITRIEAHNQKESAALVDAGVENKETTPAAAPVAAEPTPEPTPAVTDNGLAELTKALQDTMNAVIALGAKVDAQGAVVKELQEKDTQKVKAMAANTPLASLSELMRKSVTENPDTIVDGRTTLAKSGPVETRPEQRTITGIGFIDNMLNTPAQGGN